MYPVIAIDGTAASGKSTVARELSAQLHFVYVNTGLMYRAMTWWLLQQPIDLNSQQEIRTLIEHVSIDLTLQDQTLDFQINHQDPLPHIRDSIVNQNVSKISAIPEVRHLLVTRQQELANHAPLVMEGRDIGSAVFPQTPYKYYIDADPAVRAQRRLAQGEKDTITQRDHQDSTRKTSPLCRAPDAKEIDSTNLSAQAIVAFILKDLESKGLSEKSSFAFQS